MSKRFVVECTWSGYKPGGERICHREVIGPKKAAALEKVYAVRFTDGTYMRVEVRNAGFREKVAQMLGYKEVLEGCWMKGLTGTVDVMAT
jgi:hypothetical protein